MRPTSQSAIPYNTSCGRFSERARRAVFYAQEEAQKHGEGYVSTEHLLLGLLRDNESTCANVIARLKISPKRIRAEVERQLPRGDARPSQDITLTPRAKRAIDLAFDDARNMKDDYIGTEHLLLGLVREGDGLAGRVLQKLHVHLENVRQAVQGLRQEQPEKIEGRYDPYSEFSPGSPKKPADKMGRGFEPLLVLKEDGIPPTLAVLLMALADPRSLVVELLNNLELRSRDIQCILENSVLEGQIFSGPTLDECLGAASELAKTRGSGAATSADMFVAFLELSDRWAVAEYLAANECDLEEIKKALGGS